MSKRHHPVGSDAIDLVEEDLVNQDACKVTKLSIEAYRLKRFRRRSNPSKFQIRLLEEVWAYRIWWKNRY